MGIIKVLPEIIANRIAAGEVIERPGSIVKELIENSLDAGATSIEIVVRHGGKSIIRVADDGAGMMPDDAELAFQRHATSKITSAEDLDKIASYGFRGEALPSIAAVSRVKLVTRAKGRSSGAEIAIEGGHALHVKEAPCREGTIVEVRDLFFNTPARRKFLKSDATESAHIADMVANLALARLDVHFSLKSDEKFIFDLVPTEDLKARAAAILSPETAKHLLEIEGEKNGVKIRGVIGKPHVARVNRMGQIFFINRRWVKALPFSYALQEGYRGLLMHGQFPVAVVFVEVDLERVDVNVHPTKQEVRISNEQQIKSLLCETVAARLAQESDLAPQWAAAAQQPAGPTVQQPVLQYPRMPFAREVHPSFVTQPVINYPIQNAPELKQTISIRGQIAITKILGQIHHTFIVAETEEGMILIDQHAAHERLMFESLLKNIEAETPVTQRLLIDEMLELNHKHSDLLRGALQVLAQTGFDIEEFGENTFRVRAVPAAFEGQSATQVLKTFLEELEEGKVRTSLENQKENLAALVACKKKTVRAHDPLTNEGLRALVERWSECENPFSCPHGRPTFLKYSFQDFEKQFKRI